MNMHRDLPTYNGNQTHTYTIVPIAYASNEGARLAPVLKTIFHQCIFYHILVASFTLKTEPSE